MTSRLGLFRALAAVALVLLSSCGGDPTRIVVVVDSELTTLSSVHARSGAAGCTGCEHDFALTGSGAVTFPFSFAIVPRDGDASRPVELLVEGRDGAGTAVVTRTVRTGFRAGRTILLRVVLEAECEGHAPCDVMGTTCLGGACVDDRIDPATLPDVVPGTELADAGGTVQDGGGDAGDAGGALPTGCRLGDTGLVTIDPDGDGPDDPFPVYCDTSDGAAWVLIANVPDTSELNYDDTIWEDTEINANPSPGIGTGDEGLFLPYWRTPVDRLRIVMVTGAIPSARIATLDAPAATTLWDAMSAPGSVAITLSTADWAGLVGATVSLGSCRVSAIGAQMPGARVRIGAVISSSSTNCASASATAWFGVGASVDAAMGCNVPSPPIASGGAVFCGPSMQQRGFRAQALVYGR